MNLFYIENTYNGTNTVTLTTLKTGSPASGTYATSVEYSKDGSSWSTFNLTDSGTNTVTLDENEKVYFRNNSGYWNNYTSAFVQHLKIFTANQSHKIGGDLRSLIDYTDDYVDLKSECFVRLFNNDTNLTDASDLEMGQSYNITSVKSYTCFRMFDGCTGLITPPSLPFSTLGDTCYMNMFKDCTSLTTAPTLPATTLAEDCYGNMFYGCTSLNSVTTYANDISASNCLYEWLANVAATGTFYNLGSATYPTNSTSGIPTGWTQKSSIPDYFYIENTYSGSNTVTLSTTQSGFPTAGTYATSVQYSKDKNSWTTLTLTAGGTNTITLNQGEKVYFRNDSGKWNYYLTSSNYFETKITANQTHTVGGNINTLLDYTDLNNVSLSTGCFNDLFFRDSSMTSASSLSLPSTTLAQNCYYQMFSGCTSLTSAPTLPATTLATNCYSTMFSGCTSLTTAPALPATTLATGCYSGMFYGCRNLTSAPSLPATTLADGCYSGMFQSCTSLTPAPSLPATTLAQSCYSTMFSGCTSLTTAPALPATTLATNCYSTMFSGCTSLTTAPALPATTLASNCYQNMFNRCTHLTTAPSLPATTLAISCYQQMFWNCSSLTTAPALPATTLVLYCYNNMFKGCTHLTSAPALPATTLTDYCYKEMFSGCTSLNSVTTYADDITATDCITNWLNNVAATGTFNNNGTATYTVDSPSGIPVGWTEVLPSKTITATAGSNGSISPSGAVTVNVGADQTFTFIPDTGYEVDTVTVDGSTVTPTNNTYTFTNVQSDHTISVTFKVQTFTLTASAGQNGSISPSGSTTVNYGSSQTYTITPDTGYEIDTLTVDGSVVTSNTTYTFSNITANHTISVTFKKQTFTITATNSEGGEISPDGTVTVDYDDDATFEVTPLTGYLLWELLVDGVDKKDELVDNTYTFENVTANHTIHAVFDDIYLIVSVTSGPNGSITPTGDVEVIYNGNQIFNITPNEGYEIDKVMLDGVDVTDDVEDFNYTMRNIVENHLLEVTFKEKVIPTTNGFNFDQFKNRDYVKQYKIK